MPVEAVIGAIYTDAGLDRGAQVHLEAWKALLGEADAKCRAIRSPRCRNGRRDAACAAPAYRQISREGPDHAPVFTVHV